MSAAPTWPDLAAVELGPTLASLHRWIQVAGKVRLAGAPWLNHSWHVALYVSGRGLATSLIPYAPRPFDMEFDLLADALVIRTVEGEARTAPLRAQSVAAFDAAVRQALAELGVSLAFSGAPNELPDATPFAEDMALRAYDPQAARAWWRALVQAHRVLGLFRTRFLGKASPVHVFWGAFDLAVTRFSGRTAPPHPGGAPHLPDDVAREAYSHEVSSAGLWPGGQGGVEGPAFYAYAYPTPAGFAEARVEPGAAAWNAGLGEFVLPYAAVREAADPDATLLAFLQSTYEAAADLAGWDRAALEGPQGRPGRCRPTA